MKKEQFAPLTVRAIARELHAFGPTNIENFKECAAILKPEGRMTRCAAEIRALHHVTAQGQAQA